LNKDRAPAWETPATRAGRSLLFSGLLAAAAFGAFHNSFSAPFVFDDLPSIPDNPTIRHLWPLSNVFHPPSGAGDTVEGRPILNLSFALNYALDGPRPAGYHALNLAIHVAASLLLFGIVRRTASRNGFPPGADIDWFAFAVALLWVVHPLQTESVTYVVQRAESLMGLFYLLALYGFIRGAMAPSGAGTVGWLGLSWTACLLGMGTKEVMASAPIVILIYDRTFVAANWTEVIRRRKFYYLTLALTWIWLAWLVIGAGDRGGTIGIRAGVTPWEYALCQSRAIVHYIRLCIWPQPLIFDYGKDFVGPLTAAPYAAIDVALIAGTGWALRRRPEIGFLGAAFFLILVPTSTFVGGTRQMLAEHRMYLPSAAAIALAVAAIYSRVGRRAWWLIAPCALGLAATTIVRNEDYRSNLAIYSDTVAKRPGNSWAHYNLGNILAAEGRTAEAIRRFNAAIRIDARLYQAHYNLANSLAEQGQLALAEASYRTALVLKPNYAKARYNYGNLLVQMERKQEAMEQYQDAVRIQPGYSEARENLGSVLFDLGRLDEAAANYKIALQLDPGSPEAHYNLGNVLIKLGRSAEGIAELQAALRSDPNFGEARDRLARLRADAIPNR